MRHNYDNFCSFWMHVWCTLPIPEVDQRIFFGYGLRIEVQSFEKLHTGPYILNILNGLVFAYIVTVLFLSRIKWQNVHKPNHLWEGSILSFRDWILKLVGKLTRPPLIGELEYALVRYLIHDFRKWRSQSHLGLDS